MPSTGPTSGRQSDVTVASACSDIPVSREQTSCAVRRRSGVMMLLRWPPAPAALRSRRSWRATRSAGVSCMPLPWHTTCARRPAFCVHAWHRSGDLNKADVAGHGTGAALVAGHTGRAAYAYSDLGAGRGTVQVDQGVSRTVRFITPGMAIGAGG